MSTELGGCRLTIAVFPLQRWCLVCGNTGHGVGSVQHINRVPVLAPAPSAGWCGLLHTLLGPHHRQCHVLCSAGEPLANAVWEWSCVPT